MVESRIDAPDSRAAAQQVIGSDAAPTGPHPAAGRFESEVHHPDPAALSIYGQLILAGGDAAARGGDAALTRDYFGQALSSARRLGRDANHSFTAFDLTNIAVHQVHGTVVLGDGQTAIRQAMASIG